MGIGKIEQTWVVQHPDGRYLTETLYKKMPLYEFVAQSTENAHHFPSEATALLGLIRWSVEKQTIIPDLTRVSKIEQRLTTKETHIHQLNFNKYVLESNKP
jgi:hypothetical protein